MATAQKSDQQCDPTVRPTARRGMLVGGVAGAIMLIATPAALAETCTGSNFTYTVGGDPFITSAVSSITGNIVSAITTAQSAFLLQSTAFVSTPSNPQPNQQGSGVWVRAVGGEVDIKNPSVQAVQSNTPADTTPPPNGTNGTGTVTCDTKVNANFAGVQFGHDIAKLNHNGWNIHWGTTAGYLESRGSTVGGVANFAGNFPVPLNSPPLTSVNGSLTNTVQSPFAGSYLAVSKGGFFADALLRAEYYEATFNSAALGIFNQSLNARGITGAASAGYHYVVPNSKWFVEPSGGVIVSRTEIDTFNIGAIPGQGNGIGGAIRIDDIKSVVGRLGLRVGTTVAHGNWVWQPFAAASVWHEFEDAPTANYNSGPTCIGGVGPTCVGGFQSVLTTNYTGTSVGTYGQYSLGIAGQLVNTGWVAFARVDYRNGSRLEGWDGTGGLRYHFTPAASIPVIGKAPLKAPPMVAAHNWTGFYVGASAGAAFGRSDMDVDGIASPDPRGAGFIGGGQIGYNRQFAPQWVGGIELTGNWTNLNGAKECQPILLQAPGDPNFGAVNPLQQFTCHFSSRWLATLTGRVGYVWGRALWYVKAGAAATQQRIRITDDLGVVAEASGSANRFGGTVGYGVEFALTDRWSARAETSYHGFGDHTLTLSDGTVVRSDYDVITTMIGLNYKLR